MPLPMSLSGISLRDDGESLESLIAQAQTGDEIAFEALFQAHYVSICTFLVYMVGDDEWGYDLAQETFLKAWQAIPSLQNPACFESWLYSIARRQALNALRHKKLVNWLPWKEPAISTNEQGKRFEVDVEERMLLRQALALVAPRYRDCLILQVIHGLPQKRIAELLDMSKNSVSNYVSRGLEQLHRAYLQLDEE